MYCIMTAMTHALTKSNSEYGLWTILVGPSSSEALLCLVHLIKTWDTQYYVVDWVIKALIFKDVACVGRN